MIPPTERCNGTPPSIDVNFTRKFTFGWPGKPHPLKNSKKYKNISSSWFDQSIAGLTQSYTKHQMPSSELSRKKPYYVFFHSSQDELDMVGLTDSYWGNQMEILKILVRIFKAQSNT